MLFRSDLSLQVRGLNDIRNGRRYRDYDDRRGGSAGGDRTVLAGARGGRVTLESTSRRSAVVGDAIEQSGRANLVFGEKTKTTFATTSTKLEDTNILLCSLDVHFGFRVIKPKYPKVSVGGTRITAA